MFKSRTYLSAGACLVSVAALCLGSHDKIHQAFLLCFYALQVIVEEDMGMRLILSPSREQPLNLTSMH